MAHLSIVIWTYQLGKLFRQPLRMHQEFPIGTAEKKVVRTERPTENMICQEFPVRCSILISNVLKK